MIDSAVPFRRIPFRRPAATEVIFTSAAVLSALAIGLLPVSPAIALLVVGATALIAWRWPAAGLALLVASVPLQDALPARIGDGGVTWTRLLLFTVAAVWLARVATGHVRVRIVPATIGFSAMLLALAASIVAARELSLWAAELYRWAIAALVYLMATSVVRTGRDAVPLFVAFGSGAAASLGIAIYQIASSSGPPSFEARGIVRAHGLFGEPNPFAGYLEMVTLPLLAALAVRWRARVAPVRLLALLGLCGGAGALALLATQSRGGLLGFAAGCAALVWVVWPRIGPRLVIVALAGAVVLLSLPAAGPVRSGLGIDAPTNEGGVQVTPANFAARERLAHWGAAARMWRDEPWFGVGAGNFPARYREYTPEWRFRISRGHAHSAYLQAGAQAGLTGFAAYALLLGTVTAGIAARGRRSARNGWQALPAGGLAVTVAVAMHGLFEYLHVLSLGIVLSAVWAAALVEDSVDVAEPENHGHR